MTQNKMDFIRSRLDEVQVALRKETGSERLIIRQISRRRTHSRQDVHLEVLWAPWSLKKAMKKLGDSFLRNIEEGLAADLKSRVAIYWFPVSKTQLYFDDFFPRARIPEPPTPPKRVRVKIIDAPIAPPPVKKRVRIK